MGSELTAVTFDFWNTLFRVTPVMPGRLLQASAFLREHGSELGEAEVAEHFAVAQRLNDERWRAGEQFGGIGVARHLIDAILGPAADRQLVALLNERFQAPAQPGCPPVPAPGVGAALARLATAGCRLGIVSDTGFLSGVSLRRLLEQAGLAVHFEPGALAFSDEVGVPKPNPRMFARALAGLEVEPGAAAHVGDLRFTDVAGARAAGLRSIRYAGLFDDTAELPEADVVVWDHEELPAALGF